MEPLGEGGEDHLAEGLPSWWPRVWCGLFQEGGAHCCKSSWGGSHGIGQWQEPLLQAAELAQEWYGVCQQQGCEYLGGGAPGALGWAGPPPPLHSCVT